MTRKIAAGQIDRDAGARLREIRAGLKMSQSTLGAAIGVTFQQVQKYERGTNRIALSTLHAICKALNCHPMQIVGDSADLQASRRVHLDDGDVITLNARFIPGLEAAALIYQCDEHDGYYVRDDHGYDEAVAIIRAAATCNDMPAWEVSSTAQTGEARA